MKTQEKKKMIQYDNVDSGTVQIRITYEGNV